LATLDLASIYQSNAVMLLRWFGLTSWPSAMLLLP